MATKITREQFLNNSCLLPAIFNEGGKSALRQAGVHFLGLFVDDNRFYAVTLPAGWKLVNKAEISPDIYLLDEKNRQRAVIFFEGAADDFQNRAVMIKVLTRFQVKRSLEKNRHLVFATGHVNDTNHAEHRAQSVEVKLPRFIWRFGHAKRCDAALKAVEAELLSWLTRRYPRWEDLTAYWDVA